MTVTNLCTIRHHLVYVIIAAFVVVTITFRGIEDALSAGPLMMKNDASPFVLFCYKLTASKGRLYDGDAPRD